MHTVRTRGGNQKLRALRVEAGNFSWASEGIARKARIAGVVYHPSNNELVRTNTLTKSAVVQIDATPFKQWFENYYGRTLGKTKEGETRAEDQQRSEEEQKVLASRSGASKIEAGVESQFNAGRLYAVISSRPGQCGRCDGYILEGEELAFYVKRLTAKK